MNNLIIVLLICLGSFVGLFTGISIGKNSTTKETVGTLRIDSSDPDGPYLFLELHTDNIEFLYNKKTVEFDVDTTPYISQK